MKRDDEFSVQLVTKGSFVDNRLDNHSYIVETFVLRLNNVALSEWILSTMLGTQECFSNKEEWEKQRVIYKERRKVVNAKIMESLGIDQNKGHVSITQSQSDIFSVIYTREEDSKIRDVRIRSHKLYLI